ncbi:hypothetical protein K1719_025316 [Acacia pycnantha]|nr:hypothetical protein K1719_025316 [Acacia pycnantha]
MPVSEQQEIEAHPPKLEPVLFESPRLDLVFPSDLRGSNRLFVTPGLSSSVVEDSASQAVESLPQDFIAVLMFSPMPYEDFRGSMQEMVEARLKNEERVDWDFMEELLFYYLNLNEKKSHKFILSSFVDVIAGLRRRSETVLTTLPQSVRMVGIGRGLRRR